MRQQSFIHVRVARSTKSLSLSLLSLQQIYVFVYVLNGSLAHATPKLTYAFTKLTHVNTPKNSTHTDTHRNDGETFTYIAYTRRTESAHVQCPCTADDRSEMIGHAAPKTTAARCCARGSHMGLAASLSCARAESDA